MAWLAVAADGSESSAVYALKEQADAAARDWGWLVAPLYATPQPILTDEEREAIAACAAACENAAQYGIADDARRAATLRALLERTTL